MSYKSTSECRLFICMYLIFAICVLSSLTTYNLLIFLYSYIPFFPINACSNIISHSSSIFLPIYLHLNPFFCHHVVHLRHILKFLPIHPPAKHFSFLFVQTHFPLSLFLPLSHYPIQFMLLLLHSYSLSLLLNQVYWPPQLSSCLFHPYTHSPV